MYIQVRAKVLIQYMSTLNCIQEHEDVPIFTLNVIFLFYTYSYMPERLAQCIFSIGL